MDKLLNELAIECVEYFMVYSFKLFSILGSSHLLIFKWYKNCPQNPESYLEYFGFQFKRALFNILLMTDVSLTKVASPLQKAFSYNCYDPSHHP